VAGFTGEIDIAPFLPDTPAQRIAVAMDDIQDFFLPAWLTFCSLVWFV
jgi:hypothetical protein